MERVKYLPQKVERETPEIFSAIPVQHLKSNKPEFILDKIPKITSKHIIIEFDARYSLLHCKTL